MSWKLVRLSSGEKYFLLPTGVCRVGRQGCQVLIPDTTVSRHHADIIVSVAGVVSVKDVSKFVQTAVNKDVLTGEGRERNLVDKDVLTFGASEEKFILIWDPIVLAVSKPFETSPIVVLTRNLDQPIAGLVVDKATCNSSSQRVLITTAIARGIRLIKPEYLVKLAETESGVSELPQIELFTHTNFQLVAPDEAAWTVVRKSAIQMFDSDETCFPDRKKFKKVIVDHSDEVVSLQIWNSAKPTKHVKQQIDTWMEDRCTNLTQS